MADITSRQLTVFAQVVEQGSFNNCARFLNVSNVAITNQIKKLEGNIGHKLFERSPGGVAVLTGEGKHAYDLTLQILSDFTTLMDKSGKHTLSREWNISIEPFLFHYLRKEFKQFEKMHPDVNIHYEIEGIPYLDMVSQIKTNKTDIGYFFAFEEFSSPDSDFICDVPMHIYVGKEHPLANQKLVSLDDLEKFSVLKNSKNNYLSKLSSRIMEEVGLIGISVALETDNASLFSETLSADPVFTCLSQWVETTDYVSLFKRLNLETPLPDLQLRQIIRSPLSYDPLAQEAIQYFTASLPGCVCE